MEIFCADNQSRSVDIHFLQEMSIQSKNDKKNRLYVELCTYSYVISQAPEQNFG